MTPDQFLLQVNAMSDINAEKAIIEIIIDTHIPAQSQRSLALASLTSQDFTDPQAQACFDAVVYLVDCGKPVDHLTVSAELRRRRLPYQSSSVRSSLVAVGENLEHYIAIVQREGAKRQLMGVADSIIRRVPEDNTPTVDLLGEFEEAVRKCAPRGTNSNGSMPNLVEQAMSELVQRGISGNRITGISTGLSDIDWMTQGMQPDSLIVLGSRPSMGKSSMMMQLAVQAAAQNAPSLVLSLEMTAKQLVNRLLASMSHVPHNRISNAYMTEHDWERVGDAALKLADMPIVIDDATVQTTFDIRAAATRMASTVGLGVIFIDYLQIIQPINPTRNPVIDVGNISSELKSIAKEFHVPVVALAQLSRSLEHRADKRPLLSDLRDSGAVEQWADMVWFLYRDNYYKRDASGIGMEEAELIIAKNRDGKTGRSVIGFWPELMRFDNIERRYEE